MVKQDGLEWVVGTFGLEPRWTSEPDITEVELLARKHLRLEANASCHIKFFAEGAFNKLYKVETEARCSLMRVTLPVDPSNKTNSEVATIDFVRQNTNIPVPHILAYDDSSRNELGFEWILMEMLPGRTLRTKWRKLSENIKRELVKQVAGYQAQLFSYKFPTIGNIFVNPGDQPMSKGIPHTTTTADIKQARQEGQQLLHALGQMVSMIFFWGDHITQDVPRGPFANSEDWIRARLALVLTDQKRITETSDDEDDIEEAQEIQVIAERLLKLLPDIFYPNSSAPQQSVLFHDDLSMQNILVDDDGRVTGVIDWECVSALPVWRVCQLPGFLEGRDRNEEPKRNEYAPDNSVEDTEELRMEVLDNEGVNSLYWEHMLEYELTMLREVFLQEMENKAPRWIEELEKGAVKADYDYAVQNCDNSWRLHKIKSWLDAQEQGENWSLRKSFLE